MQFDYSDVIVEGKSEADWVAQQKAKDAEYEKSWADLKARFESTYLAGFSDEWGAVARHADGAAKPDGTILVQVKVIPWRWPITFRFPTPEAALRST